MKKGKYLILERRQPGEIFKKNQGISSNLFSLADRF